MAFNILIVDDSSSMRAVVKKVVRISGVNMGTCLEASDGREALKVLAENWADVVLTDINMPNMSGLELIAEMKRDELLSSIPVVLVTSEGSEEVIQSSLKLGAKGYIKKPFQPEDIRRTLVSILGEVQDETGDFCDEDEAGDF